MAHRGCYHAPPLGSEPLQLIVYLPRLVLLLRRQVLPSLHIVQHALLLLGRKAGEVLQSLAQLLLLRRRQVAEAGITFQRPLPICRRHIFMLPQPVARMSLPGMRRLRPILIWRTILVRRMILRRRMILILGRRRTEVAMLHARVHVITPSVVVLHVVTLNVITLDVVTPDVIVLTQARRHR